MKRWVITSTIDPTKLKGVVTAKMEGEDEVSGSVLFVWYNQALRRWEWVLGGGRIELIAEPTLLFLDEDWVRENSIGQLSLGL